MERTNVWLKCCTLPSTQGTQRPVPAWREDLTMNRISRTSTWWLLKLGSAVLLLTGWVATAGARDAVAEGKALFQRRFAAGELPVSGGDGIGPLFNHVSCAACHSQGGIGGGGP